MRGGTLDETYFSKNKGVQCQDLGPQKFWYMVIACVGIIPVNFPRIYNYTTGCLHLERYESEYITYENLPTVLPSNYES